LLIVYFVEKYYPRFSKIEYVRTFRELKEQYDQLQASERPTEQPQRTSTPIPSGYRAAFRNDEDENYFREDDEGEEERTKTPPLVDYPEGSLNSFVTNLTSSPSSILPFFHYITHCDSNSQFVSIVLYFCFLLFVV
jgi:hypothetical protein